MSFCAAAARVFVMLLAIGSAADAAVPGRIISASPSITEMLYALGLGDSVVGVTTYCHYPPEVRDKPKIGTYLRPSMETIVALQPDLVVVLQEHGALADQLKRAGLETLALRHNNLDGIYDSIEKLGTQIGAENRAAELVDEMRQRLTAVQRAAAGREPRTTMFIVGRTPATIADLVIVGRGPFLNELIEMAARARRSTRGAPRSSSTWATWPTPIALLKSIAARWPSYGAASFPTCRRSRHGGSTRWRTTSSSCRVRASSKPPKSCCA
jgi:iron complex transport system substrate-binding protein